MQSLAWLIDRNQFRVVIEGHTRKGLVLPKPEYTAWELSSDRANASRRALTFYAVDNELIERVTGFAETRPVPFQAPEAESNQRVTLSLTMRRHAGKAAQAVDANEKTPPPTSEEKAALKRAVTDSL